MANPAEAQALACARMLLDTVTFDSDGVTIGNQRQGGNGGLLSMDSIKAADQLRRALDHLDAMTEAAQ